MLAAGRRSKFSVTSLFLDVMTTLTVMFAAFLAVVVQVAKIDVKKAKEEAVALAVGNISVEARWPDGANVDVDLWVKAPDDRRGVGYSRRSDAQSSYVRDDLGNHNDPDKLNYENVFVRGVRPGRYIVNLHLYGKRDYQGPVKVRVRVVLMPSEVRGSEELADVTVPLESNGQEVTAVSFVLNANGNVVAGSSTTVFLPIRQGAPQ